MGPGVRARAGTFVCHSHEELPPRSGRGPWLAGGRIPGLCMPIIDNPLRHALVVGKTGTGKSTLLASVAREYIAAGWGIAVIDPHGDLVAEVDAAVPRCRRNDVVRFDATREASCPGLNPLRLRAPEARGIVCSNLLAIMRKIWPDSWGPRTEHILRHTILALLEVRSATLADAPRMLVDRARRDWVLRQASDVEVLRFWTHEFPGYGPRLEAEATAPVLNKLGALLASPVVRALVTKRRPALDAKLIMDRGRIVLASLPKGSIGEDAAYLLGSLLLGSLGEAALSRAGMPRESRRPFLLIADEATSFAIEPLLSLSAEARKFGLGLVLATQSVSALAPEVRAALLGNVGTLMVFQLGADDALQFSREFADDFGVRTLTRLGVGEMVVRSGAGAPVLVNAHGRFSATPG